MNGSRSKCRICCNFKDVIFLEINNLLSKLPNESLFYASRNLDHDSKIC